MNILVIGNGGREHALVWKLRQSPRVNTIHCIPGNAGIARIATVHEGSVLNIEGLKEYALQNKIDLTIVGPEAPLVFGIVDVFREAGLKIFGPDKQAAQLEGSKAFAKSFMNTFRIPTAQYKICSTMQQAEKAVRDLGTPLVVKASGLAAGKGVELCYSTTEALESAHAMLEKNKFGESSTEIIIEQLLEGEEASIIALCDGECLFTLVPSQDHKRALDGDKGPNTGGMGAYAPAPVITPPVMKQIEEKIFKNFLLGLHERELDFRGIIYFGLMITAQGPAVLEFNVRFGDPEAQVQLPLLNADLVELIEAVLERRLKQWVAKNPLSLSKKACVCVVAASEGYPGTYKKGLPISGLDEKDLLVFHSGTGRKGNEFITTGGRVLGVTAIGDDLEKTIEEVYTKIPKIYFPNMHFRKDIGFRALDRLKKRG
ncbi:MAG: phosphoribosylamine--glycine ligase [Elusimicrobia bacterium]|nr:phosphoribosylamine--glycine ligase [Elusimicrobiota bacterium]MBD3411838.1 phosphoribosylamine--glycine ligase [Elusimicrobiota bacterium]